MSLRIAVTSVISWPYVRRGNRFAYELARYLACRGHMVHYIATKPGVRRKMVKDGMVLEYYKLASHPFLEKLQLDKTETFIPSCLRTLCSEDFDVIQTTLNAEAFAAALNRKMKGTPFVHILYGAEPLHRDILFVRPMFGWILRTASRILVPSHYINNRLKEEFGIEGIVTHPPVDISKFIPNYEKNLTLPRILCTSPLINPRKRVSLLVKAFEKLLSQVPDAVLQLAGQTTPFDTKRILESVNKKTRERIELLKVTDDNVLGSLYRNAAISVIPSLNEAYGLVINESLASGTPVVGTRSGAVPEVISSSDIGVLFNPSEDPGDLHKALLKGLELAQDPVTSIKCRKHAEQYSWESAGPRFEMLYMDVQNNSKKVHRRLKTAREEKMEISEHSHTVSANQESLNGAFDDALDELEITYETYHEIDRQRSRCLAVGHLLLVNGIREGSVLVLSTYPLALTMFLEKIGFSVKGIQIKLDHKTTVGNDFEHQLTPSDVKTVKDLPGEYDLIICDDCLQYIPSPKETMEMFKDKIKAEGICIVTTLNVTRGSLRLSLLSGRNIFPNLIEDEAGDNKRIIPYREYTLGETEWLLAMAGFKVMQKRYIIGKKATDFYFPMRSMPLTAYLSWKLYYLVQKMIPQLRSHLVVAAKKTSQPYETNMKG